MVRRESASPRMSLADRVRRATWRHLALLALAYTLLGAAGLLLGAPSPVFPSAGLALAAVLWLGDRALPGVWLGAVMLNLGLHWVATPWLGEGLDPLLALVAAVIASGATLQAWVGSWLVRRVLGDAWRVLEHERDALRFLLVGGVLAGVLSATIGTAGLRIFGPLSASEVLYTWWTWYVGDVIGILVFAPLTLALLERRDALWRERRRRILAPLAITLVLAIMAFHTTGRWERLEQLDRLRDVGEALARDLSNRFHTHKEVLSALRYFIEANPDLEFGTFTQFTRATLHDNPDLLALNFSPLVRADERDAVETRMRERLPGGRFQILERDPAGRLVPAGPRAEYAPVTHIIPWAPNTAVVGFDNLSEPIRRAAVERVRATRQLAIAAPIHLVQEETPRFGMLEMLPVEDTRVTDADGRAPLLGLVVAVARIDQLLAIATQGKIPSGLRVELSDTETASGLLYHSHERVDASHEPQPGPRWQTLVGVGDRDWSLTIAATPAYLGDHRSWAAWGVGVAGLIFAALLQVLMLGITGRSALIQHQNEALIASERRYRELNAALERKVEERTAELREANAELDRLATTDSLTGAWNRRYFEQAAAIEISRRARYDQPLSLLLFDLDHFKAINDVHGHPVGDAILIALSERVRRVLRASDVLARWGGEEFVVMLPGCDAARAVQVAGQLRDLIAREPFPQVGRITASFGVAECHGADSLATWLERADAALYAAKASGRDQVSLAGLDERASGADDRSPRS